MSKPLVSAVVITYKAEKYIKETLDSVFSQDYDNLEIVITDDNSPDNTFSLIQQYVAGYKGPHRVIINQNNPNLGIAGNVNRGIQLSHGDYICLFDGDDISYPNRVTHSLQVMSDLNVEGMTANMELINSEGKLLDYYYKDINPEIRVYTVKDYLNGNMKSGGAARIFSKKTAELFGELNEDCQTEDTTYLFRSVLMGGIGYSSTPLVKYRIHGDNVSKGVNIYERFNPSLIYGQYIKDLKTANERRLITETEYKELNHKMSTYLTNESAVFELYRKKNIFIRFVYLQAILFSGKYSFSFKKRISRLYLSWIKNKF